MGSKYEVQYWDYHKCEYVTSGYFNSFRKQREMLRN